jgi:glycosyltransferase involved in cell wall biosynthesis
MQVIHVVSSLNVGGAERFVIDLAVEQQQNHHFNTTILSMGKEGEPLEKEVKRFGLGLVHGTKIRQLRSYLSEFDIVHVHSSYSLLRILLASMFLPIKVIYTRHNERVHTSVKWRLIYFIAKFRLHKMVFVAEKARKNYLATYPEFKHKSCTVLNGVLPMKTTKSKSDKFRIAHVGRFVPLKAQHFLIQAVAKLPKNIQDKLSLSFFGTGELMQNNKELAQELIPNVEVNFRGFVTDRDAIYGSCDLLVVTSETEGLSLAILEALASGTPTIASDVGGNPELVNNNVNGFLYEYANTQQLADNIQKLYKDTNIYIQFSERSLNLFREEFSMGQCESNYYACYQ